MNFLIFTHEVEKIENLIEKLDELNEKKCKELINSRDSKGNTPLILTVKLSRSNSNYFKIAKILLTYGANPKIRDKNGWSPMEEAVCQVLFCK